MIGLLRKIWHILKKQYRTITNPVIGDVLMFHRVTSCRSYLEKNKNLEVTPEFFETIVLRYKQEGYQFISLSNW